MNLNFRAGAVSAVIIVAGILVDGVFGDGQAPKSGGKAGESGSEVKKSDPTPESVLKEFLMAVVVADLARIDAVSLPHPDVDVLAQGQPVPAKAEGEQRTQLDATHFVRLKRGDKVTLPGGQQLVMDESHVNENRVQLTFTGNPVPFILVREDGQWKVEPDTLIAARLAGRDISVAKEDRQNWAPDSAMAKNLQEEAKVTAYYVRPPKAYQRAASEKTAPVTIWKGAERADGTQPTISILAGKLPAEHENAGPEAILKDSLAQAARRRSRWRQGVIERGTIDGHAAARVRWTGVSHPTTVAAYSEKAMRGVIYALTIGNGDYLLVMSQDLEQYHRESLPLAEAAARTIRVAK